MGKKFDLNLNYVNNLEIKVYRTLLYLNSYKVLISKLFKVLKGTTRWLGMRGGLFRLGYVDEELIGYSNLGHHDQ
jgi:hypothetical protein